MVGKLFLLDAQERDKHEEQHDVEHALETRPVDAAPVLPLLACHTAPATRAQSIQTNMRRVPSPPQCLASLRHCGSKCTTLTSQPSHRPLESSPRMLGLLRSTPAVIASIITTIIIAQDLDQHLLLVCLLRATSNTIALATLFTVAIAIAHGLGKLRHDRFERTVAGHRVLPTAQQRFAAHGTRVHFRERRIQAVAAEALAAASREHGRLERVQTDRTPQEAGAAQIARSIRRPHALLKSRNQYPSVLNKK